MAVFRYMHVHICLSTAMLALVCVSGVFIISLYSPQYLEAFALYFS